MLDELMTTMEAGDTLDHYRLEATVAHSGMSTLYRATDLNSGGQVALKVPHAEMESDPILLERFKREQEIGQELDHPGVVKTYNSEQRSRPYMVIEWVEGRLLRAILNEEGPDNKGRLPIDRAVKITLGICDALDYMHKHGVVHRDLKPENVMVDEWNRIKLIDFGIAIDSMSEGASGRIRPALGERCLISARRKGRGGFCLEREFEEEERAKAKRAPSGGASGRPAAPAATSARVRAPVSAVNSPAAIRRRFAARISPRINPLIPSHPLLPIRGNPTLRPSRGTPVGDPDERVESRRRLPGLERGLGPRHALSEVCRNARDDERGGSVHENHVARVAPESPEDRAQDLGVRSGISALERAGTSLVEAEVDGAELEQFDVPSAHLGGERAPEGQKLVPSRLVRKHERVLGAERREGTRDH